MPAPLTCLAIVDTASNADRGEHFRELNATASRSAELARRRKT